MEAPDWPGSFIRGSGCRRVCCQQTARQRAPRLFRLKPRSSDLVRPILLRLARDSGSKSARSEITSDLFKAVKMSRLAQRLGAGVGITAGIRVARLFKSRLSLCIRLVFGVSRRRWAWADDEAAHLWFDQHSVFLRHRAATPLLID
jgi:hypothetical protein